MMNPDIKKRWVAALRSGEYAQGKQVLHDFSKSGESRYCCLGVLCELAAKDGVCKAVKSVAFPWEIHYDSIATFLPKSVQNWGGLTESDPRVEVIPNEVLTASKFLPSDRPKVLPLSYLNDNGASFERIATFIEEQL